MENTEIVDIKRKLLALQREARELAYAYRNKYAKQHLLEINALLGLCVIQWNYAEMANEDVDRGGTGDLYKEASGTPPCTHGYVRRWDCDDCVTGKRGNEEIS